jgi:hypothetical protein
MTHTPGPWNLWCSERGEFYVSASGQEFVICSRNPVDYRGAESVANAHLIAAAPDLLAALRDAAETIDSLDKQGGTLVHPTPRQLIDATNVVIRAAIAKAEGKS